MQRRHDIDALRVLAFALLILYHVGMVYVADWGFHVKSPHQAEWLQWPMLFLNRWRMPLLFAISGMAIGLYRPERGPARFALLRSWRLLLPLAFGMLLVVPVQAWCEAVANGAFQAGFGEFLWRYLQLRSWPDGGWTGASHGVTWNHLWYLAYLWLYTIGLLLALPLLRSTAGRRAIEWLVARRGIWLVLPPALYFFAILLWLEPRFPKTHALTGDWYLHAEYVPVFLFGYLVARSDQFWTELARLRRATLPVALLAISVELLLRAAGRYLPPDMVSASLARVPWHEIELAARALYTWTALLAIFGWGRVLLDRPFRWLPYATEAVYPWYILHQSLIVPIAFLLVPLQLGAATEAGLVLAGTVAGCLLLHEFVIRRNAVLRPLFGLKRRGSGGAALTAMPAPVAESAG